MNISVDILKNNISHSVITFTSYLKSLAAEDNIGDLFKKILNCIMDLTKNVEELCNVIHPPKKQYFTVVLYLMRYCSAIKLFQEQLNKRSDSNSIAVEVKRCISKYFLSLLENYAVIFNSDGDITIGSFLMLMDAALSKLAIIDVNQGQKLAQLNLNSTTIIIEEILCVSMSIAQVAYDDDNKIISAGCRSVLQALENVKAEISKEKVNTAMCNLVVDNCINVLCTIETRVNVSVLKLCLRIFSEYTQPVDNLYNFCSNDNSIINDEKLNSLISDFDLHMDRIFQICFFSVASSKIENRVIDIKNIVGNFELLENEMVPTFISMFKNSSHSTRTFADILKKCWCSQLKSLRKAVHGIIEPSAYCKLVYEELEQNIQELWQDIIIRKNLLNKSMLSPFFKYTKELGRMVYEGMDCFEDDIKCNVQKHLQTVHKVLGELQAATETLLVENLETKNAKKVLKRCQILIMAIKQLWLNMVGEDECNPTANEDEHNLSMEPCIQVQNDKLKKILSRSKLLVKDRSIYSKNHTNNTLNAAFKGSMSKQEGLQEINVPIKTPQWKHSHFREKTKNASKNDISIISKVYPYMNSSCNDIAVML